MKIQLLAACVAAGILAGCGGSDDGPLPNSTRVQAFDGAIQGIAGTYDCDNGAEQGALPATGFDGFSTVTGAADSLLITNPSICTFTFEPTAGAVDVSNGKAMDDLSLTLPAGLASGSTLQASPLSTLVADAMEEQGAEYSEALATDVLTLLGLADALNIVSVNQLLTDLDGAIATLESADTDQASNLVATTHLLSDVLVEQQSGAVNLTVQEAANVTVNLTTSVIDDNPNYPASGLNGTGDDVVVEAKQTIVANEEILKQDPNDFNRDEVDVPTEPSDPVDPPPTGGTGSGSGSGGSGGGGD